MPENLAESWSVIPALAAGAVGLQSDRGREPQLPPSHLWIQALGGWASEVPWL